MDIHGRAASAFVTGATGFLGSYVVSELLDSGFGRVYVLARGNDKNDATNRFRNLVWERQEIVSALNKRVFVVCGDVCDERLGMEAKQYAALAREVTHIVHAAAVVGVNETAKRFASVNVDGTTNTLLFAAACMQAGGLERFVHVSTAYVAGTRTGTVYERELVETTFNSLYEQSKFAAEQIVRHAASFMPITVVRPTQIVGDTKTGFVSTFNTLYYPLKRYLKGELRVLPVRGDQRLNMVPVDVVARLVVRALVNPDMAGKTIHATLPKEKQPTVAELLEFVRAWSVQSLGVDPGRLPKVGVPLAGQAGRLRNLAATSAPKRKSPLQNMLALAPYFSENRTYDTTNAQSLMPEGWPDWRGFLPHLLAYATRKGFLNHTERTVFQQMLVRLASRKSSLTYYDVSSQGMLRMDAAHMRDAMLRAAGALHARGVGPGDRVAIVGVNSTRYLAADAAIGLVGATSVPLYYTSPAADIVRLSQRAGAKMVFVGTKTLANELAVSLDVPLVSMLEQEAPEGITSWSEFLCEAEPLDSLPAVPFDSIATIRSTSGTTGEPKGVLFDQYQLRWMGEVMPSLLDWRTRNAKLRYLSFLPMSHVVEGILVAYAPYFILSDIEMYFLNDFGALAQTLPKVRPTLFFSVPRFYEKVWNQFAASSAGRAWIAMPEGTQKRLMAVPLRRALLRRAGLDQCRQLLVGSAPMSLELLESFRSLGIEIHNAFGVTEAPLITLSRLGSNELGSVGEPLPSTEVRIGDDGQVLVRGPQVFRGYDGMEQSVVDADGWFCTGDLATWSPGGNLVLNGRAKEILVTSYGKNIAPQKIEILLKDIDGVSEAMVVAEGKPFTTALLWLEDGVEDSDFAALDASVRAANEHLSHPEQVKRWIVANEPLTTATGELTPNFKVRRNVVAQKRATVVDALYDGWDAASGAMPAGALHQGEA